MRMGLGLGLSNSGGWGDDFVMTVRTAATPETFTIPCAAGTYSAQIDWGDGTANSTITAFNDADLAHSYATPGDYTVRISGTFPYIYFNNLGDRLKVLTVEQMGRVGWQSMQASFYGCANMTKFIAGNNDWSGDRSFANTWRTCTLMTQCDLAGIWANGVRPTTMAFAFHTASSLVSLNLSGCDFSVNVSMGSAFRAMTALTALTLPDNAVTALCTTMNNMFYQSTSLETFNTTGWDTSGVTDFGSVLRGMGSVNVDISGWRFTAATGTTLFLEGSILATAQYDAALIEWDGVDMKDSLSLDFGTSKYTGGGAAAAARAALIATDLWVIADGGIAP